MCFVYSIAAEDADTFLMEVSGFLREFGCPHRSLSDGPVTERLTSKEDKLMLIGKITSSSLFQWNYILHTKGISRDNQHLFYIDCGMLLTMKTVFQ